MFGKLVKNIQIVSNAAFQFTHIVKMLFKKSTNGAKEESDWSNGYQIAWELIHLIVRIQKNSKDQN